MRAESPRPEGHREGGARCRHDGGRMVTLNDRTWCTETPAVDDRAARRAQFEREALVHLDALYSFALKLARARDDAQDLVSDTLLRAFERWEQYHLGTNIRAWLFTILYHVFVSRKRRIDAREVQQPDDTEGWALFEAAPVAHALVESEEAAGGDGLHRPDEPHALADLVDRQFGRVDGEHGEEPFHDADRLIGCAGRGRRGGVHGTSSRRSR